MSSSAPTEPLEVLAWPYRETTNPYTRDLYDTMRGRWPGRVDVDDLRLTDAWRRHADVVHVHWPEAAVESSSTVRAALKVAALLTTLHLLRRRGATVVWTAHNLASHERRHPWLEAVLRRCFFPMVDGVIHLSPGSIVDVGREVPSLATTPSAVVRHGVNVADTRCCPSKQAARDALGIERGELVWLAVGTIRPYKEVPSLTRAFVAAELPSSRLVVAGRPTTPATEAAVVAAASGSPSVMLALGWLGPDEFATYVAAADVVVTGYQELHNSGVVISALARGRPVLSRRSSSTEDLQDLVGRDWLALVDGPPTSHTLQEHEPWARATRDGRPPLDRLRPEIIACETVEAYDRFVEARTAGRGPRVRSAPTGRAGDPPPSRGRSA